MTLYLVRWTDQVWHKFYAPIGENTYQYVAEEYAKSCPEKSGHILVKRSRSTSPIKVFQIERRTSVKEI